MNTYFLVTFVNGDYKIGQFMPCYEKGKVCIGRNEYPADKIELVEQIPIDKVETVYKVAHDKSLDRHELKKRLKEELLLDKGPSYVFAFYSKKWGYDIYIGYTENSRR